MPSSQKNGLFLSILFLSLVAGLDAPAAQACSRVLWADGAGTVLVGRNMDLPANPPTELWILPRGIRHDGLNLDPSAPVPDETAGPAAGNPLVWTSQYGSVIATIYDAAVVDGLNEKGLNACVLELDEAEYGPRDVKVPGLAVVFWVSFFLDNFATVDEAVRYLEKNPIQIVSPDLTGMVSAETAALAPPGLHEQIPMHLALADATGDSAIIEYSNNGKMNIWHGPQYAVLTNSPLYDWQLENVQKYAGLGGSLPLPGSASPEDRFVRAAYYLQCLSAPGNPDEAVNFLDSVLANIAEPFDTTGDWPTYWSTESDLTRGRYYFRSTTSSANFWVDLNKLDFSPLAPIRKLDLVNSSNLTGEVSARFALEALSPQLTQNFAALMAHVPACGAGLAPVSLLLMALSIGTMSFWIRRENKP